MPSRFAASSSSTLLQAALRALVGGSCIASLAAGCSASGSGSNLGSGGGAAAGGTAGLGGGGGSLMIDGGGGTGATTGGGIPQTCAEAITKQSYIGCEYWPTVTSNSGLFQGFEYAIAVANPTASPGDVKVERGGQVVAQVTVAPGDLQTIKLPWVAQLKQTAVTSKLVQGGAYKVTSTVPITMYQFNPLEFELNPPPATCDTTNGGGHCYSFTNDASIVLPVTALRGQYYAIAYPTFHIGQKAFGQTQWSDTPGFVSVTATQNGTTVNVKSSSFLRAGNGVAALPPGGVGTYSLNAGDVLVLASGDLPAMETPQPSRPCNTQPNGAVNVVSCPSTPDYDLTGTLIDADKPVGVFAGHDCTFIPYTRFACDHIEESIFPVEALGKDLIVTAPQSMKGVNSATSMPDSMFVRVLSAADNNQITFDPPVSGGVTLNAGQWIEIGPVTLDFRVLGTDKLMVAQFMVGENFSGQSAGGGDPSESIAIPAEQYRLTYTFLAPSSYTYNFVNVVAPAGAGVSIDGATIPVAEFVPIGSSGLGVARHKIGGGAHSMTGNKNFGIVVYGYGSYTSYMYPGGLNLETIVIHPH